MDGGERGRLAHSAASRYARPPPPAPVHTPRDSTTAAAAASAAASRASSRALNNTAITLDQVRTGPRPQNEYVDNPTAQAVPAIPPRSRGTTSHALVNHNHMDILHTIVPRPETRSLLESSERTAPLSALSQPSPIFRQPTSASVTTTHTTKVPNLDSRTSSQKDDVLSKDLTEHARQHSDNDSIICRRCGKCKCHQCTQHRELPHRWICGNKVRCGAMDMVEYCTCVCGVKALVYHCMYDGESDSGGDDDPCGCCEQAHCCKRWTLMGLLSVCFPCLCCYWPLRCGVAACTACYNRCTRRGCHCRKDKSQNMSRLLIDSESSST